MDIDNRDYTHLRISLPSSASRYDSFNLLSWDQFYFNGKLFGFLLNGKQDLNVLKKCIILLDLLVSE